MKKRVAIIGSGPAGYAAALYASRADHSVTIFAGSEPGGQLMKTTEIENFPGAASGTTGPALMLSMQEQATRFGGELVFETVLRIKLRTAGRPTSSGSAGRFEIETESNSYQMDAVILTMGAAPRMLGIGEEKYWGKGLSTCAVCDAAFYRGKTAYVVGGGDSAIEDAVALTKFASEVNLLVRGEKLRASKPMQKKLGGSTIKVWYNTTIKEIIGESKIEKLILTTNEGEVTVSTDGLFLAIGHIPATKFVEAAGVALDEQGYIKTGLVHGEVSWLTDYPTMTNVVGVFAAGDCVDYRYRQAAVASGMGVMAALDCEKWLEN